jgi:hypothetical protein
MVRSPTGAVADFFFVISGSGRPLLTSASPGRGDGAGAASYGVIGKGLEILQH